MVLPDNLDALARFGQLDSGVDAGGGDNSTEVTTPVDSTNASDTPAASSDSQDTTADPSTPVVQPATADARDAELARLRQQLAEIESRRAGTDRRLTQEQQRRIAAEQERNMLAQQTMIAQMNELGWDQNQQQFAMQQFQQQIALQQQQEQVQQQSEAAAQALRTMTALGMAAQAGFAPEEFAQVLGPQATYEQMQNYAVLRKNQIDAQKAQAEQAQRTQQKQQRAESGVDKPPVKQEVSQPPKRPETLDEAVAYMTALGRR